MYTYKVVTTLTNPQSQEWQELVQRTLGVDIHQDRKMGFMLAREALKQALFEKGIERKISELTLLRYDEVEGLPQLTISLSHSKSCGAAIAAERKEYRSIGIDVEEESRVVKDSIRERIAHPRDGNFRNIEIWCAKEAVFKALMNTGLFDKPIEFSSIQITGNRWFHSPSKLEGEWKLELSRPYVTALAFLRN